MQLLSLIVWDALIAWRDDVLKKEIMRKTRINYLSHMFSLIESGVINLENPLSEFLKTRPEDKLKIITENSWSQSTKLFRYTILRSFYKFSKKRSIKPTFIGIPINKENNSVDMLSVSELLSSNEDKAKSQYLTPEEINRFLKELRSLNFRDFLICWTMWELKCTIHQVLILSPKSINYTSGIITISECEGRFGNLREDLRALIQKQSEGKTNLLFPTDKGKPVHPGQIVRNMKIASLRAELPIIISPKIIYSHAQTCYEKIKNEVFL